jgi:hypothetical protein
MKNNMRIMVTLVIVMLFQAACAHKLTPPETYIGMSSIDVVAVVGQPNLTYRGNDGRTFFTYVYKFRGSGICKVNFITNTKDIVETVSYNEAQWHNGYVGHPCNVFKP